MKPIVIGKLWTDKKTKKDWHNVIIYYNDYRLETMPKISNGEYWKEGGYYLFIEFFKNSEFWTNQKEFFNGCIFEIIKVKSKDDLN